MFVDRVKIFVKAGDGGRGCISFRREKYVPKGGPDGGTGGRGGDVVLVAVSNQNTLLPLRYHAELRAERGRHGGPGNRSGREGEDLLIEVPPGTVALDIASGQPLGEVLQEGERLRVAEGGRGGRGNQSFLSNSNRAPREAEPGGTGEERWLRLDLRLLADVGLLGLPNAGKSTLLASISAARPKVGDYPFTTLTPVLGVVGVDDTSFVVADIPGIIEGAHAGAGLGLDFLRHVERTSALAYVIDTSGTSGGDPALELATLREEIRAWNPALLERPQVVVASKRDALSGTDPLPALRTAAEAQGLDVMEISAVTGQGLPELRRRLAALIAAPPASVPLAPESLAGELLP
jgi:GTP-binding protein